MAEQTQSWLRNLPAQVQGWSDAAVNAVKTGGRAIRDFVDPASKVPTLGPAGPDEFPEVKGPPKPPMTVNPQGQVYQEQQPWKRAPMEVVQNPDGSARAVYSRPNSITAPQPAPQPQLRGTAQGAQGDLFRTAAQPGLSPDHPLNVTARPGDPAVFGGGGGTPPRPPSGGASSAATPPPPPLRSAAPVPPSEGYTAGLQAGKRVSTLSRLTGGGRLNVAGELLDPNVREALDPESKVTTEGRLKQLSRSALRVGGGILGSVAGVAGGGGLASIPLGIAGGAVGYKLGDKTADWLNGPAPQQGAVPAAPETAAAQPVESGTVNAAPVPQTPKSPDGFSGLRGAAKENATDFIDGTDNILPVPKSGEGYIRNNDTNAIYYRAPGNNTNEYAGLRGDQSGGGDVVPNSVRELSKKGPFGAMAAMGIVGAVDRQKANAANVSLREQAIQASRDTANARLNYDMYKDNRDYTTQRNDHAELRSDKAKEQEQTNMKITDQAAEDRAREVTPQPGTMGSILPGAQAQYEGAVKSEAAKRKSLYANSAANMLGPDGKRRTTGTISQSDVARLNILDDLRMRLEASRGTWQSQLGNYTGTTQRNTRDLNNLEPSHYEPSAIPSVNKWLVLRTGEKLPMVQAVGGQWHMLGSNEPIDKQLLDMADSANAKYKPKGK